MVDPKFEAIQSWLTKARQDMDAAIWLLESPIGLFGAVGFHCQQAVEKALKAYLTWLDCSFEKTHSLVVLVGMCLDTDPNFEDLRVAAVTLTPYAVITRYPGDLPVISLEEANTAIELAHGAYEFILAKLPNDVQG
jgi:HEPN domain-containing protein